MGFKESVKVGDQVSIGVINKKDKNKSNSNQQKNQEVLEHDKKAKN